MPSHAAELATEQLVLHRAQRQHEPQRRDDGLRAGRLPVHRLGDGGGGGDPFENGQSKNTLLGKILRINVNGTGAGPYDDHSIPTDNPLRATARLDEIWAYGLRNPWRFSFDRETGNLFIADVGQSSTRK